MAHDIKLWDLTFPCQSLDNKLKISGVLPSESVCEGGGKDSSGDSAKAAGSVFGRSDGFRAKTQSVK